MKARYSEMIEQLTGRKVLAFLSQAHVDPDLTVEVFLMDGRLQDSARSNSFSTMTKADGPRRPVSPVSVDRTLWPHSRSASNDCVTASLKTASGSKKLSVRTGWASGYG